MKFWVQGCLVMLMVFSSFHIGWAEESSGTFEYVALGDSLTVGYEPGVQQPYSFTDRLYEQNLYYHPTTFTNYGVVGLTSSGLKNWMSAVEEGKSIKTSDIQADFYGGKPSSAVLNVQSVKEKLADADLITISIGGNDLRLIPFVVMGKPKTESDQMIEMALESYHNNLLASLEALYRINPDVQIVIADQYQPIPPIHQELYQTLEKARVSFTSKLDELVTHFQGQNREIAKAPVSDRFNGRVLELTHLGKMDVHPNQQGYQEMAEVFAEVIWGTYHEPVQRDPVTIIFDGKEFRPPYAPLILQDRVYVTLREYAEALGTEVKWVAETKEVAVVHGGKAIRVRVGSDAMKVGDQIVKLPAPVQLHQSKTYVPLRAIAEGFGVKVAYLDRSRTVFMHRK